MLFIEVDNTAKSTSSFEHINGTYKFLKYRMGFLRAGILPSWAADENEAKDLRVLEKNVWLKQ